MTSPPTVHAALDPTAAVDCHSHYVPPNLFDLVRGRESRFGMAVEERGDVKLLRLENYIYTGRPFPLPRRFWALDERLQAMHDAGVKLSLLSPPTFFFLHWAPVDAAAEMARATNDGVAEVAERHPHSVLGLATCPLQDGEAAAREVERALGLPGMVGAIIGTSVGDLDLDNDRSRVFFEYCNAARVPLFIHPTGSSPSPRQQRYYLANLVGLPVETAMAAAVLIFAGVLDRCPDLPLLLAHGGGVFPWLASRWDQGHRVRPECQDSSRGRPSEYLRRFYYDSVVHDAARVRCLAELVGWDRLVLGTDCPADMGVAPDSDAATVALTTGGAAVRQLNALEWLGLRARRAG